MSRRLARESAMKLIFQMEAQENYSEELIQRYISELPEEPRENEYVKDIGKTFIEHREEIDEKIESNAKEWKLNRIAKVDLAILRVAVTEILYREDIPVSVVINEAVEIAKNYSTDEASSFVNGILGSLSEVRD